jgi:hypothetical protein
MKRALPRRTKSGRFTSRRPARRPTKAKRRTNPPYLIESYRKLFGQPIHQAWGRFSVFSPTGKLVHPGNSRQAWDQFWFAVKDSLPTTCRKYIKLRAKTGLGPASPREMTEMCLHAAKVGRNPKRRNPDEVKAPVVVAVAPTLPAKTNPRRRNPHATHIDHAAYQAKVRKLTEAQLHYIMRDAKAAERAHPTGHKAGYYLDEIHYCADELARRRKGGVRENPQGRTELISVEIRDAKGVVGRMSGTAFINMMRPMAGIGSRAFLGDYIKTYNQTFGKQNGMRAVLAPLNTRSNPKHPKYHRVIVAKLPGYPRVNIAKQLAWARRGIKRNQKATTPAGLARRKMFVEYARALKEGCRFNPDEVKAAAPVLPPVPMMPPALVAKTNPRRRSPDTLHTSWWVSYGPDAYHWGHTCHRALSLAAAKAKLASRPSWADAGVVVKMVNNIFGNRASRKVVVATSKHVAAVASKHLHGTY